MEQKDLNKKIQELESKLEEATRPSWFTRLIKRTSFAQGFIFSVLLTSAVGVAFTLPGTPFVTGNVISAADVNTKFAAIETKLDELDGGFASSMSGSQNVPCGASGMGIAAEIEFDTAGKNDGGYNNATFTYTVPKTGYYRVFYKVSIPTSNNTLYEAKLVVNGTPETAKVSDDSQEVIRSFNINDTVNLTAACDDKGGNEDDPMILNSNTNIFAVTPL